MSDDYIKKALEETAKQLGELFLQSQSLKRQEIEIERQLFKLKAQARSLAALCDDIPPDSLIGQLVKKAAKMGLTESVREVLRGTGEWMTPTQLRDYLIRIQTDLTRYRNPVGSIHTILGRLLQSEEIEEKEDEKTKKTVYRWKTPIFWDEIGIGKETVAGVMMMPKPKAKDKKKE